MRTDAWLQCFRRSRALGPPSRCRRERGQKTGFASKTSQTRSMSGDGQTHYGLGAQGPVDDAPFLILRSHRF